MNVHAKTLNKDKLVVIGISSRIMTQAAVDAGFEVVAFDAFADTDTCNLAKQVIQLPLIDGQLDGRALISELAQLDLDGVIGFCYGAGFEAQPQVLAEVAQRLPLFGNNAETVKQSKAPRHFFNLCDDLQIPHPDWKNERPENQHGWLVKRIGGSGGEHVEGLHGAQIDGDVYYQRLQEGTSVSCLFLALANRIELIGYSEQWTVDNGAGDYRYSGAINATKISDDAKEKLISYVGRLSIKLGLLGINSCDAIVCDDDVFVIEVNPRLSASMDLFKSNSCGLLEAHIASFTKREVAINLDGAVRAHEVVRAQTSLKVKRQEWPAWVCDVPARGEVIRSGMPVCTLKVEAPSANEARALLENRKKQLQDFLI